MYQKCSTLDLMIFILGTLHVFYIFPYHIAHFVLPNTEPLIISYTPVSLYQSHDTSANGREIIIAFIMCQRSEK